MGRRVFGEGLLPTSACALHTSRRTPDAHTATGSPDGELAPLLLRRGSHKDGHSAPQEDHHRERIAHQEVAPDDGHEVRACVDAWGLATGEQQCILKASVLGETLGKDALRYAAAELVLVQRASGHNAGQGGVLGGGIQALCDQGAEEVLEQRACGAAAHRDDHGHRRDEHEDRKAALQVLQEEVRHEQRRVDLAPGVDDLNPQVDLGQAPSPLPRAQVHRARNPPRATTADFSRADLPRLQVLGVGLGPHEARAEAPTVRLQLLVVLRPRRRGDLGPAGLQREADEGAQQHREDEEDEVVDRRRPAPARLPVPGTELRLLRGHLRGRRGDQGLPHAALPPRRYSHGGAVGGVAPCRRAELRVLRSGLRRGGSALLGAASPSCRRRDLDDDIGALRAPLH
mmetsp:Transcript_25353/g.71152  ORF Transcript_25353/g.71152 Transcript_25353/m.71152 type:complete len:400 (-) Transcript_25353:100-1299(-)